MNQLMKLPVGIDDFEKIRQNNFYYVDKTKLIERIVEDWGEANLFTRPRRFGKSLNISMLKNFFEIGCNKELFDGLYISYNSEICEKYMGKFPVVSISLKSINADNFNNARSMLIKVVNEEVRRHQYLNQSTKLTEIDKQLYRELLNRNMDEGTLAYSLKELTELLCKHFGKQVIVLIDEYDVPLSKANDNKYYDEMILLIRNLFENVLKTNKNLYFAIVTGCFRVARESIFTGLNNLKTFSITNVAFDEYFGFTDKEVNQMLQYYNIDNDYEVVKEWYDGYRFGNVDVYCPWDVINYCADHLYNNHTQPLNYWLNTSNNEVIKHFINDISDSQNVTKAELEKLVNGGMVQKEICEELTYKELYSTPENIWSAMFMTGYLTQRGEPDGRRYNLVIPNREVRNIITEHILTLFKQQVKNDGDMINKLCNALLQGENVLVEQLFTEYMQKTISIRDTFVHKSTKENFYHGMLLGILSYKSNWIISSNKESGDGFSDIMIQTDINDIAIVIEMKYAHDGKLENECKKAIQQIKSNNYEQFLKDEGADKILKYGIACYKKKCKVLCEK